MRSNGRRALLGAVLAGGESTRYGSPKWLVTVGGRAMAVRAASALAPHVGEVVAVSRDPRAAGPGVRVWPDLEPGLGPLGGIHTALVWARELSLDGVVVLACDLPLVSADLVEVLVDRWRGQDAVAPLGPSGPEPLCALYAASSLPRLERALSRGERSPRWLLRRLEVAWLPLGEARAASGVEDPFLNVNTPAARARAETELPEDSRRGPLGGGAPVGGGASFRRVP